MATDTLFGKSVSHYRITRQPGSGGMGIVYEAEALDALAKAWRVGYRDSDWAWRDPGLALLHEEPEFERLFPNKGGTA